MNSQSRVKYILASVITITGVVVFAFVFVNAAIYTPNGDTDGLQVPTTTTETAKNDPLLAIQNVNNNVAAVESASVAPAVPSAPSNFPDKILIPKISVDASIQYVGLTTKNNLAVPSNFIDTAWYEDGPVPGQNGTAIIDGHLDDGLGFPAVFWNLSKLSVGDEIDITTNGGRTLRFAVTQTDTYNYNDPNASAEIFAQSNAPTIRLITCAGSWVESAKMYNERTVVTAQLIN